MYDHANQSLEPHLQEYEVVLPLGAYKHLKMPKMCQKLLTSAHFCNFKALYRLASDLNTCPILMYDHVNQSLGSPLQEYRVTLPLATCH